MHRSTPHQAGFSASVIIIAVLVIGVIAGIGVFVFNDRSDVKSVALPPTDTPSTTSRADDSGATKSAQPGASQPYLLEIKEWNVTLPLPDSAKDAYYTTVGGGVGEDGLANTVWVSLRSLDGTSCDIAKTGPTESKNPVGFIGKVLPDELEPVKGVPYKELYKDGVMIEKYYYFYVASVIADCKSKQELEPINASLKSAIKNVSKTTARER